MEFEELTKPEQKAFAMIQASKVVPIDMVRKHVFFYHRKRTIEAINQLERYGLVKLTTFGYIQWTGVFPEKTYD